MFKRIIGILAATIILCCNNDGNNSNPLLTQEERDKRFRDSMDLVLKNEIENKKRRELYKKQQTYFGTYNHDSIIYIGMILL